MRLVLVFLLGLLIGCSNSVTDPDIIFTDTKVPLSVNINGEEMFHVMDSILVPNAVTCVNDALFINEMGSKGLFHAIDLKSETYLGNFGVIGEGPGELMAPFFLSKNEPDELQVFDPQLKKVVSFPSRLDSTNFTYTKEFLLNRIESTPSISVVGGDVYGLSVLNADYRIFYYDTEGEFHKGFGRLPIREKQPERILTVINYSNLTHHNGIFALGYYSAPLLQIFNLSTKEWILVKGPNDFTSEYRIRPNPSAPFAYSEKTRIGYVDVKISDKFIYALYSGDLLFNEQYNHDKIYVFDFQGNPVKKLVLNKGVLKFDVYKDRYIYGLQYGEEYKLLKFSIED